MNANYRSIAAKKFLLGCLCAFVLAGGWRARTLFAADPAAATPAKEKAKPTAEELRAKYPFESLAPRLEYEKQRVEAEKDRPAPKLSEAAEKKLAAADGELVPAKTGRRTSWNDTRSESLRLLHSDEVDKFIAREGFGMDRMMPPPPSPHYLEPRKSEPIPFAKKAESSAAEGEGERVELPKSETAAAQSNPLRLPPVDFLGAKLQGDATNFSNPWGFGYVKDREHVAGFQPHQFTYAQPLWYPSPKTQEEVAKNDKWLIGSMELVSLLKHEKPAVYISENLPRMDELKAAKTRDLSKFEAAALEKLRTGEELVADATTNHIAMLGAVRASKQCLECHYVQRGELLGAFSYELLRDPPLKVAAPVDKPAQ